MKVKNNRVENIYYQIDEKGRGYISNSGNDIAYINLNGKTFLKISELICLPSGSIIDLRGERPNILIEMFSNMESVENKIVENYQKVNPEKVKEIRELIHKGYSEKEIYNHVKRKVGE